MIELEMSATDGNASHAAQDTEALPLMHARAHPHATAASEASATNRHVSDLRIDVGHTRIKAGNADLYMTPQLKHRMYTPDEDADGQAQARTRSDGGSIAESAGGPPALSRLTTACYSVGHFMNDATASCWFSYLLLYLEQVQNLSGVEAGIVLFSGQLFDALATPTVGILSDRSKGIAFTWCNLGRRKLWNALGVAIVLVCFLFVFGICLPCFWDSASHPVSSTVKTVVFAIFASLFNVGWAAVQVSHMAMVPELTHDEGERVFLNSLRYAFTILANVLVFVIMWVILHFENSGSEDNKYSAATYSWLTYSVLASGGLLSAMFLIGTHEHVITDGPSEAPKPRKAADVETQPLVTPDVLAGDDEARPAPTKPTRTNAASLNASRQVGLDVGRKSVMKWSDWLVLIDFYKVAFVYMFTRLAVNVSQVYLSFFVTQSLSMDQTALAVVPLLVYVSSLIATTAMKRLTSVLGRRNSMTIGSVLFAGACVFMLFVQESFASLIYVAALLLGAGSAITMVISVSLEADLVGRNVESAAFLYGAISFTDKLSNGIAVLAIQYIGDGVSSEARGQFIRYVNALVPLVAIGLAMFIAWSIKFPKHLRGTMEQQKAQRPAKRNKLREYLARASTFTTLRSRHDSQDDSSAESLLQSDGQPASRRGSS